MSISTHWTPSSDAASAPDPAFGFGSGSSSSRFSSPTEVTGTLGLPPTPRVVASYSQLPVDAPESHACSGTSDVSCARPMTATVHRAAAIRSITAVGVHSSIRRTTSSADAIASGETAAWARIARPVVPTTTRWL